MREEAVLFGEKKSLVGVLTDPTVGPPGVGDVAAILLNAGILHRVGPGRIYVRIARELAALGFTAFRFDFSGIGDSKPRYDNLPFDKSSIDETQSAMDLLQEKRGIRRFILIGGCSGARVSFATACSDPRVVGGILINFPAAADDDGNLNPGLSKRKDEHYYLNFAIRDFQSWCKFFTGKADYRKIFGALAFRLRRRFRPEKDPPPEWHVFRQNLDSVIRRGVRPVFVCSPGDPRLEDLREAGGRKLTELCSRGKTELIIIPRSDHTFSSLFDQELLIKIIREKALEIARWGVEELSLLNPSNSEPTVALRRPRS